ncbi:MAG TPA: hypothetical protein VIY72_02645 [Acidimicrobiales bacterium]
MRRSLALLAVVALALLSLWSIASARALSGTHLETVTDATPEDWMATQVDDPGESDAAVTGASYSMLAATPLLVKRAPVWARSMFLALLVVAVALVRRPVSRIEWSWSGWRPHLLSRLEGAPHRGPPSGALPALRS